MNIRSNEQLTIHDCQTSRRDQLAWDHPCRVGHGQQRRRHDCTPPPLAPPALSLSRPTSTTTTTTTTPTPLHQPHHLTNPSPPPPPPHSDSCVSSATPLLIQCDEWCSLGSLTSMTKLVEWPVVDSTPRLSAVLYMGAR